MHATQLVLAYAVAVLSITSGSTARSLMQEQCQPGTNRIACNYGRTLCPAGMYCFAQHSNSGYCRLFGSGGQDCVQACTYGQNDCASGLHCRAIHTSSGYCVYHDWYDPNYIADEATTAYLIETGGFPP